MPVAYVFMDEAGDLGFSAKATESYVMEYIIMKSSTPHFIRNKCCRLLRKVNSALSERLKISEFKFSRDSYETRIKFFDLINSFQIDAGAVAIRKDSVAEHLKDDPNVLYNYLAIHHIIPVLIRDYLKSSMPSNRIKFMVDKSLTKINRDRFNDYYDKSISAVKWKEGFKSDIFAEIQHLNSQNDVCLQIADYVAGAVFHLTEMDDRQYYEIISQKVKYKDKWDWNKKIRW